MARMLKHLLVGFAVFFPAALIAFMFIYPFEEAVVSAAILAAAYGLMGAGFMRRLMKTQELLITPANKDPEKPMAWYVDQIRQQLADMRFKKVGKQTDFEVYHPRGYAKVWERKVELSSDVYHVKVKASRTMIRIISDLVEVAPQEVSRS